MAINVEFLMSGRQFVSSSSDNAVSKPSDSEPASTGPKLSETQRLAAFVQRTSCAAAAASAARKATSSPAHMPCINIDFLRSGKQFTHALLAASPSSRTTTDSESHAARLERFYRRTLAGYAGGPSGPSVPPPTLVNTAFLRSGKQFGQPTQARSSADSRSSGSRKTREQRLADFRQQTARAAEKAAAVTVDNTPVPIPTVVNLAFLRSSAFRDSRDDSRVVKPAPATGAASPATARKMARSRYARLENFYKQTLEAHRPKRMSASG